MNKLNKIIVSVLGLLAVSGLTGCFNPVERMQEEAGERFAEVLIETAAGGDLDLDLEYDDESFSMTYEDENGETVEINVAADEDGGSYTIDNGEESMQYEVEYEENFDQIEGMGFSIDLPDGITNGSLQRTDQNGEAFSVGGAFDIETSDIQGLLDELHASLEGEGFVYEDLFGEADSPSAEAFNVHLYNHPEGHMFTIMLDESSALLSLTAPIEE